MGAFEDRHVLSAFSTVLVKAVSAIDSNERSGLQTRIATTESVSLCVRGEKLTAFVELEAAIRSSSESS
jgi:hypothetical protein